MNFFVLILIFATLLGCNSPNPHPELLDPIYLDIERDLKDSSAAISAEEKNLEDLKKALSSVKPQTGQIKYATKRIYDSEARISKLKQMNTYLKLKLDTRAKEDSKSYIAAFRQEKPWPNPEEYKTYKSYKALQSAPRAWNPAARIEASKIKRPVTSSHGDGHGEQSEHH